jgi:hypothetical protein
MHRHVLAQGRIACMADHDADSRPVQVAGQRTVTGFEKHEATHVDVLADLGHQRLARGVDRVIPTGERRGEQRIEVGRSLFQRGLRDRHGKVAEVVALGDEVGLAVDLDHRHTAAVGGLGDLDGSLGGHLAGALAGLGQAALAHQLDRGLDVATGLDQRLLALHHAGAGALTQLLDHARGNRHLFTPRCYSGSPAGA